jgi:hypothetical protein
VVVLAFVGLDPQRVAALLRQASLQARTDSRQAALKALSRAKLNGRIGHVGDDRQNEVTGQEPRPGTTVECGSVVTISLGVDRGYS